MNSTLLRRPALALTALTLGTSMALTGCTGKKPEPAPSPTVTSATPTPVQTVPGADATLTQVLTDLYAGKDVPLGAAAQSLRNRKPAALAADAKAGTGEWKGTKIATATSGKDTTFLVQDKGTWKVVGGWWPSMSVTSTLSTKRFVFFMGSDARPGEDVERQRADALHIVGFDGKDGGGLVGIARDTWVPNLNGRPAKINAQLSSGGPDQQMSLVARVSGLPLKEWILGDFEGFMAMVDELGGLEYTLPPVAAKRGLKPGTQKLGGYDLLLWARERKTLVRGDFDRSANQNLMMVAGAVAARTAGPTNLPRYLTAISKHLRSNMTAESALTFFASIYQINPAKVGHGVAAGSVGTSSAGASIVVPGAAEKALYADLADGNVTPR